MESQRGLLFVALLVVSYLLFNQWQMDKVEVNPITETTTPASQANSTETGGSNEFLPEGSTDTTPALASTAADTIVIRSDVLELVVTTQGGDIVSAKLLDFETEQGSNVPMPILTTNGYTFVAESGLVGANGPDSTRSGLPRPVYSVSSDIFEIGEADTLMVPFTYQRDGLTFVKNFILTRGKYDLNVKYDINNNSQNAASMQLFGQLKQSVNVDTGSSLMMPTYRGAAFSTVDTKYEKYDFDDIESEKLNQTTKAGWVAMLQHYFVSAWVPQNDLTNTLYTNYSDDKATIGFLSPTINIAPGASASTEATFYVGPKNQAALEKVAEGLELTVDYGFLWMISQPLFALLMFIQGIVVNWGLAIICITIVVKTFLYPLTKTQYTSMAKMRKIQPKMQALKERYGNDRQKMSQAMMELYKKEKVNPAGGCLPLLLQMPIFLALYWVFMESVELRHAEFGLWITDLSSKDPYYILPILMGASMFLMQKLQPAMSQDPMQQKMMQWMPVFFTFFFLWFPSGLVLYWLVSNVITIIQMLIIFRSIEKAEEKDKLAKKSS
ncbi:membrane protein insertase YidC [Thalassotalea aquiviva]|uniref:membrane protein insertase YidC n=1 Tax=Thalassotalea aquiviva TaxID=3242415 RepID=UPI00352B0051